MAIGDFIGRSSAVLKAVVVTKYEADIDDMVKDIKKLEKAQTKQGDEAKKSGKVQEEAMGRLRTGWTEMASAIGLIGGAYGKLRESMDVYVRDAQLKHASAGVSIEGLRRASRGLIRDTDLMSLAAAGLNNGMGTTQKQLEAVAGFMVELQHQGNKSEEVIQTLTKSLAEGGVEELQKFGVGLRDASGALVGKGEPGFNALVEEAARQSKNLGDAAGDDAARGIVAMDDALKDLNVTLGKIASSLAPVLKDVANISTNYAELLEEMSRQGILNPDIKTGGRKGGFVGIALTLAAGSGASGTGMADALARQRMAGQGALNDARAVSKQNEEFARLRLGGVKRKDGTWWMPGDTFGLALGPMTELDAWRAGGGKGKFGRGKAGIPTMSRAAMEEFAFANPASLSRGIRPRGTEFGIGPGADLGLGALAGEPDIGTGGPGGGFFGPAIEDAGIKAEQFTDSASQVVASSVMASQAMGMFASTATSAWGAFVSGSLSAGQAAKKFAGDFVFGQSMQMFSTGVTEGIFSLVDLFRGNFGGAAGHAKTSAGAFAAAAALGAMASALGAGGSAPGVGAGVGGFAAGRGAGGTTQSKTIIVGRDAFDDRSERRMTASMKRIIQEPGEGVSFS